MVHWIEQREQLGRAIAVAKPCESHDVPERSVRVLAAVLANARHVTLDVTRTRGHVIERRRQEQDEAVLTTHQPLVDGCHRLPRARGIAGPREHRPRLRDGVYLAL